MIWTVLYAPLLTLQRFAGIRRGLARSSVHMLVYLKSSLRVATLGCMSYLLHISGRRRIIGITARLGVIPRGTVLTTTALPLLPGPVSISLAASASTYQPVWPYIVA